MSCFYTPNDIALFIYYSDFKHSDERLAIKSIWEQDNASLPLKFRNDFQLLKKTIYFYLAKVDVDHKDIMEMILLTQESGSNHFLHEDEDEKDFIETYFKIIKLELTYLQGCSYRKVKLRSLLKIFGYRRRSAKLVEKIKQTLSELELQTYLKDYLPCDVSDVDMDDMIIIRLKIGN